MQRFIRGKEGGENKTLKEAMDECIANLKEVLKPAEEVVTDGVVKCQYEVRMGTLGVLGVEFWGEESADKCDVILFYQNDKGVLGNTLAIDDIQFEILYNLVKDRVYHVKGDSYILKTDDEAKNIDGGYKERFEVEEDKYILIEYIEEGEETDNKEANPYEVKVEIPKEYIGKVYTILKSIKVLVDSKYEIEG